jgi:NADH-quinone oxidoreductase subunit N
MFLSQFIYIWPEIFLSLSAIIILMLGVFSNSYSFKGMNILALFAICFATYILYAIVPKNEASFLNDLFKSNLLIYSLKFALLLASSIFILFYKGQKFSKDNILTKFEFPVLVLFSIAGMMLMLSANNFLSFYVCLELQSLALYILAAFDREDRKSSEAGLKYFIMGSFASGLLLFGISLVYGFTGNLSFDYLSQASSYNSLIALIFGIILILIGLFFKASAVPFHLWTPDVYQGAPILVTSLFANIAKIAALGFLLRFTTQIISNYKVEIQPIMIIATVATALIGALGALKQENIKRLLAYSSIGHVGFMLLAISSFSLDASVVTYLIIYICMNLPIFAIIMASKKNGTMIENLSDFSGLSKTNPMLAFTIAVFMFSLAGIPPFAGFFAKFYVFQNAINAANYFALIACVIAAIISAYYYLKIVKIMYFDEPSDSIIMEISLPSKIMISLLVAFNLLFILL